MEEIKVLASKFAPSYLPIVLISDANVVVSAAILITQGVAEIMVGYGNIIARNSKEQVGGANAHIELTQVLSIGKANMFKGRAAPTLVDKAGVRVPTVLARRAE